MSKKPDASVPTKRDGLVVQTIGDEAIVYDGKTHEAHSLNRTAALVFQHVDGKSQLPEIAGKVGADLGRAADDRLVKVALDRLAAAGLLTKPSSGRRAVIRGIAVALLPVITTVLVPKPAGAASCGTSGAPCTTPTDCCPGYVCCGGSGCHLSFCP